jgi:hypothetical protein
MPSSHAQRIERYLQKHPGATLAEARGHGKTPERPGQGKGEERFREYYEKRETLEKQVLSQKQRDFSSSDKWRADRSARAVKKNPGRMSDMQLYIDSGLAGLMELDDFDWMDERWAWLRYH